MWSEPSRKPASTKNRHVDFRCALQAREAAIASSKIWQCCEKYFKAKKVTICFPSGSDPEQSLDKLRLSLRITSG
jgi:hypothetical protein